MTAAVLFPDAALVAVEAIRAGLVERGDTTHVGTTIPSPRPAALIQAHRVGGVRATVVSDRAQIAVESWDATAEAAHDRAQLCRALLHQLADTSHNGVAVYRVGELGGPAELPDPLSDNPRYVFTVELHLRGAALTAGS